MVLFHLFLVLYYYCDLFEVLSFILQRAYEGQLYSVAIIIKMAWTPRQSQIALTRRLLLCSPNHNFLVANLHLVVK